MGQRDRPHLQSGLRGGLTGGDGGPRTALPPAPCGCFFIDSVSGLEPAGLVEHGATCYITGMTIRSGPSDAAWPPPVLWPTPGRCLWVTGDGEIEELSRRAARRRIRNDLAIVCHARSAARRLGLERIAAFDVLELFAFVRPAQFCVPTPGGLAAHFGEPRPATPLDEALSLIGIAERLLDEVAGQADDPAAVDIARAMQDCGWQWGPLVLDALGGGAAAGPDRGSGFAVWERLDEWSEYGPEPAAGNVEVERDEARTRLAGLLGDGAEERLGQADYAAAVTDAFLPRQNKDEPNVVLAEAGTGVGKTLGYIAPASVWAEKNRGAVWISTYTRNLQHQIDRELDRLAPDPVRKSRKVVIRKGRENYLCLLNLEEATPGRVMGLNRDDGTALGLMARWAAVTRSGDMTGGDFPAWLADLLGHSRTLGLADRRGECLYSTCPHYHRCFIEKSVRLARHADMVIANHALVMVQAALGGVDDAYVPNRYVFDEGHHVFDAADSAFSAFLSGAETAELRRWLTGAQSERRRRTRGLESRLGGVLAAEPDMRETLNRILEAVGALPGEGWLRRLLDGHPRGPAERFFDHVRRQVLARNGDGGAGYTIETDVRPAVDGLLDAAAALDQALQRLLTPAVALCGQLKQYREENARTLETAARSSIDAVIRVLTRRGEVAIGGWRAMLGALADERSEDFVDWFELVRIDGTERDVGMRRHWLDPTVPLHDAVIRPAHGVLITSATLRDASGDADGDWRAAEARTGSAHLPKPAVRVAVASPFDYARQTRVFIVNDVERGDRDQVASAYRELFLAAGGGALGLFTAIRRLREVHERIAAAVDDAGFPLYAQHVDGLDLATLIEIFRAEENACLLGTDAVRDGVDVPGHSLRLIAFDRVPWPRPDILFGARADAFGRRAYTDMLVRLKLKQAFGRLIRRADDYGAFVLLDRGMPERLRGAFPEVTPVKRCGLAEAVAETRAFLESAGA